MSELTDKQRRRAVFSDDRGDSWQLYRSRECAQGGLFERPGGKDRDEREATISNGFG